jgi:hypothetical protein
MSIQAMNTSTFDEFTNDSLFEECFHMSGMELLLQQCEGEELDFDDILFDEGNDSVQYTRDLEKCLFADEIEEVLQICSNIEVDKVLRETVVVTPVDPCLSNNNFKLEPSTPTSGLACIKSFQPPRRTSIDLGRFL